MNNQIHLEARYPDSIERVWQALTDPHFLSKWLMPADFEPRIGYRFSLKSDTQAITGEVLECDGKSRLVYTWEDGESDQPSIVAWALSPDGDGTRLTLDHMEFVAAEPHVIIEMDMNWRQASSRLAHWLGYPPVPIVYVLDEPERFALAKAGFLQPEMNKERASCN